MALDKILESYFVTHLDQFDRAAYRTGYWPLCTLYLTVDRHVLFLVRKIRAISDDGVIAIGPSNARFTLPAGRAIFVHGDVKVGDRFVYYPPTKALFLIPAAKADELLKRPA